MRKSLFLFLFLSGSVFASSLVNEFLKLEQKNKWKRVGELRLKFKTFHPQGLYIVGDRAFLTAVEILEKPKRYDKPDASGKDRGKGKGRAYLLVFSTKNGELEKKIKLAEDDFYHPGGLDFDGKNLWTALAHYRPYSVSKVISINPETFKVQKHGVVQDHLGAVIFDRDAQKLLALNWGGRSYYQWNIDAKTQALKNQTQSVNPNLYIDYQDCQYLTQNRAICFGLARFKLHVLSSTAIGGVELIDTVHKRPLYQVPVLEWLKPYLPMTNNPSFVRMDKGKLQFYFIPEDDESSLYIYQSVDRF